MTLENSSNTSQSSAIAPPRSNPLSWQQRPSSRGSVAGSARNRPPSALASDSMTSRSPRLNAGVARAEADDLSKNQIAQSLEAKDPTFFRQTQDRGLGSAAYRKNQVEDEADPNPTLRSMRLPGMSRETSSRDDDQSQNSTTGSLEESTRSLQSASSSQRLGAIKSDTTPSLGGDEQPLTGRTIAMSPSQGRLSSERKDRPLSPTKGLGGFVQSAMMKRSDSVNKRWSAQAGPGLSRGNSVTSTLGSQDGIRFPVGGATPVAISRQSSTRETTPSVSSRPTSSQSNQKSLLQSIDDETLSVETSLGNKPGDLPRNNSEANSSSKKGYTTPPEKPAGELVATSFASPSKRWSPTKSSWLGNAISKPESPKVLSPAISQQPAWMADLNRTRQQRGSVDLQNAPTFDKVAVEGLVKSPPPGVGYKSASLGGPPSGVKVDLTTKPRTDSFDKERLSGQGQLLGQIEEQSGSATVQNSSADVVKAPKSPPFKSSRSVGASITSPSAKPDTPPKKDFRTNLKPQQIPGESKGKAEPEFKNVFGKLKKTQTQNYVAPDELKENIVRGKTGLARTGGPQKSIIRDEFKESILKKKEGMNVPTASTKISSASSKNPDTSTPEAIAKHMGLGRSESHAGSKNDHRVEDRKPAPKPEALSRLQNLQEKSRPTINSSPLTGERNPEKPKPGVGGGFASSLAGILQKGPPQPTRSTVNRTQTSKDDDTSAKPLSTNAGVESESASGPELTHATKGRARGPKRKPPSAMNRESTTGPEAVQTKSPPIPALTQNRPLITTLPQRDIDTERPGLKPLSTITDNQTNIGKSRQPTTAQHSSFSTGKDVSGNLPSLKSAGASNEKSSSPLTPVTSPDPTADSQRTPGVQKKNTTKIQETNDKVQNPSLPKGASDLSIDGVMKGEKQETPRALPSVKGMADTWSQSPKAPQPGLPRSPIKLPTKVDEEAAMTVAGLRNNDVIGLGIDIQPRSTKSSQPSAVIEAAESRRSPPLPDKKLVLLQQTKEAATANTKVKPIEPMKPDTERVLNAMQIPQQREGAASPKTPKSPPTPGKKPVTVDSKVSTPHLPTINPPKRTTSPLKEPSESAKLFANIFDESPSKTNINIDTQAVLDKDLSGGSEKIKTLRKHIIEITDNGKSEPVPSDQEHILFQDSIYLCTHVFGTSTGARKTEVYLWCGDGVSPSAIEDAQLFARKTAKDAGGKLILLRQGKEPSIFFQALGGIVITRRGSSSRSDSATYILCGRRHLGQIAFDEVDFHPHSLCVGFPYIISARGGRLYLWKGDGASADELGCARLIGMDLGLTGEIEEVEVGKEPADFWSSFPTGISKSATTPMKGRHWHLKPTCEKYAHKLFEIDVEYSRPKSSSGFMSWGRRGSAINSDGNSNLEAKIKEIAPFSQADLVEDGVFVLDAFFEVFV